MLREIIEKILRKRRFNRVFMVLPSPYLDLLSQYLISLQSDDGSWFQDPLNTAIILQALYVYSTAVGVDFQENLRRGVRYLEGMLRNLSRDILSSTSLYSELDQKAITFGNALYTVGIIKSLKKLDEDIFLAFRRLEESVVRYCRALANVEAISSIVKCYLLPFMDRPPERLISFLLGVCLRNEQTKDVFIALNTLILLQKKGHDFLERLWQRESKRYQNWRKMEYKEWLNEVVYEKLKQVDNKDIESLAYGLIVASQLQITDFIIKLGKMLFIKLDPFWKVLFKGKVNEAEIIIHEISIALMALSTSPFVHSVFMPFQQVDYLLEAEKWYREHIEKRVLLLSKKYYYALLTYSTILTILSVFLILSILMKNVYSVIASLLAGFLWFVMGVLWKKPSGEEG